MIAILCKRLFLALCVVLAWGAGSGDARAADNYDYCTIFTGARTHLFLLDRSAQYGDEDLSRLGRGIQMWGGETLKAGDRVIIQTVADYVSTSLETMNMCVPACPPKDAIKWYDSCNLDMVERDQTNFRAAMANALDARALAQANPKAETALAEVIYASTARHRPNTLTIFSDFMEFHPKGKGGINFYKANGAELSSYYKYLGESRLRPALQGVAVTGFGLRKDLGPNPKTVSEAQWEAVYRFWVKLFQDAGANGISLETEYGGRALPPPSGPAPALIRSPG